MATGGGPLNIRGGIYLCADPAVNASGQGYNGRLLELAIWDEPLSKEAIQVFYTRVRSGVGCLHLLNTYLSSLGQQCTQA